MNTPAFADAHHDLGAHGRKCAPRSPRRGRTCCSCSTTSGIGGSERKIVRLANRLKEEGVHVSLACLNGPFTIEQGIRRDVPLAKLERSGKFSFSALLRLRRDHRARAPSTVIAVNLYQALYVVLACMLLPYRPRTVALVNTSTFRGHRVWKRIYQSVLCAFRPHRARLRCAARVLVQGRTAGAWANSA